MKRLPRDPRAEGWYKKHIAYLGKMESRLNVFESSLLRHSAELLLIAFECHRQNAASYRDAGFRISTGTAMIRHGRIGVVFCAAALECAISTVLAVLCMRTKPRIQRGLLMESVGGFRNRDATRALRMFFPNFRLFDKPELQELFSSRNEILHARPRYYEDYAGHIANKGPARMITKWTKSLSTPVTESTLWVTELPKYLDLALQILESLAQRLRVPVRGKLPKMRKDHPILEMRKYEAKHGRRRRASA
jgi:hypothetical protein